MASSAERTAALFNQVTNVDNTTENVNKIYSTWADTYDKDFDGDSKYVGPYEVAKGTAKLLEDRKHAKIMDLGAGTGLVSEEIHKMGFCNVDALDPNEDMLEKAKEKGIYDNIICDSLGPNKLQIEDATYDAAMMAGTFVPNHANDSCFEEVIRILKPGGFFVFAIAAKYLGFDEFLTFEPRIQQLEDAGFWKLISKETVPYLSVITMEGTTETRTAQMFTIKKQQ